MKKICLLVIASIMAVCFTACGKDTAEEQSLSLIHIYGGAHHLFVYGAEGVGLAAVICGCGIGFHAHCHLVSVHAEIHCGRAGRRRCEGLIQ